MGFSVSEHLVFWRKVNEHGECLEIHSLRGVFATGGKDIVIDLIEYSAVQRLEARIQKLREALKDIHANCKSPDCYFEECKTAKEALQADDEDSKR